MPQVAVGRPPGRNGARRGDSQGWGRLSPVRTLGQPNASFADDRGEADPTLRALLASAYESNTHYLRAVVALCVGRFLLPIVVDPDSEGDTAAVLVTSASGQVGVIVFSGLDLMTAWDPKARPVPCTLDDVAATAVETDAQAVIIDYAGPHPVVLERDLIDQLAQGRRLVELADGEFAWVSIEREAPEQP